MKDAIIVLIASVVAAIVGALVAPSLGIRQDVGAVIGFFLPQL